MILSKPVIRVILFLTSFLVFGALFFLAKPTSVFAICSDARDTCNWTVTLDNQSGSEPVTYELTGTTNTSLLGGSSQGTLLSSGPFRTQILTFAGGGCFSDSDLGRTLSATFLITYASGQSETRTASAQATLYDAAKGDCGASPATLNLTPPAPSPTCDNGGLNDASCYPGISRTVSCSGTTVFWSKPSGGSPSSYTVTVAGNSVSYGDVGSRFVTNLALDSDISYSVAASYAGGYYATNFSRTSSGSFRTYGNSQCAPASRTISSLQCVAGGGTRETRDVNATFSWSTPSAGSPSRYEFWRNGTLGSSTATSPRTGTFEMNTSHNWEIKTVWGGITYSYGTEPSFSTGNCVPGSFPLSLNYSCVSGSLTPRANLSWDAAANGSGNDVVRYDVLRYETSGGGGGVTLVTLHAGTTYTDTGITRGEDYFYRVRAYYPNKRYDGDNRLNSGPLGGVGSEGTLVTVPGAPKCGAKYDLTVDTNSLTTKAGGTVTFTFSSSIISGWEANWPATLRIAPRTGASGNGVPCTSNLSSYAAITSSPSPTTSGFRMTCQKGKFNWPGGRVTDEIEVAINAGNSTFAPTATTYLFTANACDESTHADGYRLSSLNPGDAPSADNCYSVDFSIRVNPKVATCDDDVFGENQFVGCLYKDNNDGGIFFDVLKGDAPSGPVLSSPVIQNYAGALNFNWGSGSPNTTLVGDDYYALRWRGRFLFKAGSYTFTGGADDGIRVMFSTRAGAPWLINDWPGGHAYQETSIHRTFDTDQDVYITVEFHDYVSLAQVKFGWSNSVPRGSYDVADGANCRVGGWAFDEDGTGYRYPDNTATDLSSNVRIIRDSTNTADAGTVEATGTKISGPGPNGDFVTDNLRTDVNNVYAPLDGVHGFNIFFDETSGLVDGSVHTLYILAVDLNGVGQPKTLLGGKNIQCQRKLDFKVEWVPGSWGTKYKVGDMFQGKIRITSNKPPTNVSFSGSAGVNIYYGDWSPVNTCPGSVMPAPASPGYTFNTNTLVPSVYPINPGDTTRDIDISFPVSSTPKTYTAYAYIFTGCGNETASTTWGDNLSSGATYTVDTTSWFKTTGGDVGSGGSIVLNQAPVTGNFTATYLVSAEGNGELITQRVTVKSQGDGSTGWFVSRHPGKLSVPSGSVYQYLSDHFHKTAEETGTRTCSPSATGNTFYLCEGGAAFDATTLPAGNRVFFIDGDLTINGNIQTSGASDSAIFIVSGRIVIAKAVTRIDGIYVAGTTIQTATDAELSDTKAAQLTVNGALYAGEVKFVRECDGSATCRSNQQDPAEVVAFQPKYLTLLKDLIGVSAITWQEVAP